MKKKEEEYQDKIELWNSFDRLTSGKDKTLSGDQ